MPLFFNAAAAEMTEQGEPFLIMGESVRSFSASVRVRRVSDGLKVPFAEDG